MQFTFQCSAIYYGDEITLDGTTEPLRDADIYGMG